RRGGQPRWRHAGVAARDVEDRRNRRSGRPRRGHEARHERGTLHPARRPPARHRQRELPDVAAPDTMEQARGRMASRPRARSGAHDRLRRPADAFRCVSERHRSRTHGGAGGGGYPPLTGTRRQASGIRRRDDGKRTERAMTYAEFHRRSLEDREAFWRDEARLVDWHTPYTQVLDYSRPPFAKWFVGGRTNLCHN